jgi:RNA polymerase sigma factor (sigma-70 family)
VVVRRVSELLLHLVARGDQVAVKELTRKYAGLVYALARRMCMSQSEVEDAVQEVFIALWQSGARFDPSIAAEETFVSMIARRRLIDRRRRAQRRSVEQATEDLSYVAQPGGSGGEPGASSGLSEEARLATELLKTLRPEQQQVLRLAVGRGFSHEQISALLGLPLGTVKTHVRRGLIALREAMQKHRAGANPGVLPVEGACSDRQGTLPGHPTTSDHASANGRAGGVAGAADDVRAARPERRAAGEV